MKLSDFLEVVIEKNFLINRNNKKELSE